MHIDVPVPDQDLDVQRHRSWSFFVFSELRWEVLVRFVDIGGIVDHNMIYQTFTLGNISSQNLLHTDYLT